MSMVQDIVMPKIGLTMTEGLLTEWRVAPGGRVAVGDILFVIETEKVAVEVEATTAGVIDSLLIPVGTTVPVGEPVARLTLAGNGTPLPTVATATAAPEAKPALPKPDIPTPATQAASAPAAAAVKTGDGAARLLATPLARRLARQRGIDLHQLRGSGPHGRIKAVDVTAGVAAAAGIAPALAPAPAPASPPAPAGRWQPATATELTIARRLGGAKQQIPHFYVAADAAADALLALRQDLNALDGPRISLNHMLVAAAARALAEMPEANRVWRDDGFESFATVDIGIAADTPRGLLVPMLRDAGRLTVDGIAARAGLLVQRARDGRLTPADMGGGVLTISNVGMHGVRYLTPIINPGQAMILGVGGVQPVFRPDGAGQPTLRQEIGLVLACDHRVLDGVRAALLLNRIIGFIEQPLRLLRGPHHQDTGS